MTFGVARRVNHCRDGTSLPERDHVAIRYLPSAVLCQQSSSVKTRTRKPSIIAHRDIDAGDPLLVGLGSHYGAPSQLLQLQITACVVIVVVRVEDVGQLPASNSTIFHHPFDRGRIYSRCAPRAFVVNEIAVIVTATRKLNYFNALYTGSRR